MATGVAPWLYPPNFIQAMSSGAQAGLQLRAQNIAAQEAAQRLALAQQQQAAAEAQAAERLRLAQDELFAQAQQNEMANRLKAEMFAQEQQRFQAQQERYARLDEANRLYREQKLGGAEFDDSVLGTGAPVEGTDFLAVRTGRGAIQLIPKAITEAPKAHPITNDAGEVIGTAVQTPKGLSVHYNKELPPTKITEKTGLLGEEKSTTRFERASSPEPAAIPLSTEEAPKPSKEELLRALRLQHPDWDKDKIKAEIKRILSE